MWIVSFCSQWRPSQPINTSNHTDRCSEQSVIGPFYHSKAEEWYVILLVVKKRSRAYLKILRWRWVTLRTFDTSVYRLPRFSLLHEHHWTFMCAGVCINHLLVHILLGRLVKDFGLWAHLLWRPLWYLSVAGHGRKMGRYRILRCRVIKESWFISRNCVMRRELMSPMDVLEPGKPGEMNWKKYNFV